MLWAYHDTPLLRNGRWVDEEHIKCRAEDGENLAKTLTTLRTEIDEKLKSMHEQCARSLLPSPLSPLPSPPCLVSASRYPRRRCAEAIVPLGEEGALSTLRTSLERIDTLGEAVGQLCGCAAYPRPFT